LNFKETKLKYAKTGVFFEEYVVQHKNTPYLCIVFFMVLDLRLTEDWVVVRQPFFFGSVVKSMLIKLERLYIFTTLPNFKQLSLVVEIIPELHFEYGIDFRHLWGIKYTSN